MQLHVCQIKGTTKPLMSILDISKYSEVVFLTHSSANKTPLLVVGVHLMVGDSVKLCWVWYMRYMWYILATWPHK